MMLLFLFAIFTSTSGSPNPCDNLIAVCSQIPSDLCDQSVKKCVERYPDKLPELCANERLCRPALTFSNESQVVRFAVDLCLSSNSSDNRTVCNALDEMCAVEKRPNYCAVFVPKHNMVKCKKGLKSDGCLEALCNQNVHDHLDFRLRRGFVENCSEQIKKDCKERNGQSCREVLENLSPSLTTNVIVTSCDNFSSTQEYCKILYDVALHKKDVINTVFQRFSCHSLNSTLCKSLVTFCSEHDYNDNCATPLYSECRTNRWTKDCVRLMDKAICPYLSAMSASCACWFNNRRRTNTITEMKSNVGRCQRVLEEYQQCQSFSPKVVTEMLAGFNIAYTTDEKLEILKIKRKPTYFSKTVALELASLAFAGNFSSTFYKRECLHVLTVPHMCKTLAEFCTKELAGTPDCKELLVLRASTEKMIVYVGSPQESVKEVMRMIIDKCTNHGMEHDPSHCLMITYAGWHHFVLENLYLALCDKTYKQYSNQCQLMQYEMRKYPIVFFRVVCQRMGGRGKTCLHMLSECLQGKFHREKREQCMMEVVAPACHIPELYKYVASHCSIPTADLFLVMSWLLPPFLLYVLLLVRCTGRPA